MMRWHHSVYWCGAALMCVCVCVVFNCSYYLLPLHYSTVAGLYHRSFPQHVSSESFTSLSAFISGLDWIKSTSCFLLSASCELSPVAYRSAAISPDGFSLFVVVTSRIIIIVSFFPRSLLLRVSWFRLVVSCVPVVDGIIDGR